MSDRTQPVQMTVRCNDGELEITFNPPDADHAAPYTVVLTSNGIFTLALPTTEFVKQMSAVMLEAFEWVGGPFGMLPRVQR